MFEQITMLQSIEMQMKYLPDTFTNIFYGNHYLLYYYMEKKYIHI